MFQGGIETLDYFSRQMGREFEACGLSVFYFNLKDTKSSAKRVKKFIRSGETVMLTFNFEGLEREDDIYEPGQGYIWQGYNMPIYNIAADHPYFYHERIMALLEDEQKRPGLLTMYHHLSIDRNHETYLKRFYPFLQDGGFFPLAGNELENDLVNEGFDNKLIPIKDRKINVLFTGNYTELSFFDRFIHGINKEYAVFYQGIIDDLIANSDKTVEEVAISHIIDELGPQKDEDLRLPLHKMIFIDMYVRNYFRGKVVSELVDGGTSVTVIGKDWDKLKVKRKELLDIRPQTNSLECVKALRNSKISLNVMPWFKDGAHDRVFNSILNGAVSFSDGSVYQQQELVDGQGIKYYLLNGNLQENNLLSELLSNDRQLQQISDNGIGIVKDKHTWRSRARYFLAFFSV